MVWGYASTEAEVESDGPFRLVRGRIESEQWMRVPAPRIQEEHEQDDPGEVAERQARATQEPDSAGWGHIRQHGVAGSPGLDARKNGS